MPAPPNQDSSTAIELGPLPSTFTQRVDDSGITYTVWYKYTATFTGEVGFFAFGDLTVYKPFTHVHSPDDVTTYLIPSATNVPIQIPVVNGQVYYFEVHKVGNVSPSNLTVNAQAFTTQAVPVGSLFVNDDTPDFPAAILSQTDGSVLQFVQRFAAGEAGDILDDGSRMAFEDDANGVVTIYDSNLLPVAASPTVLTPLISTNKTTRFYLGFRGGGAVQSSAKTMTTAGVLGTTIGPFGSAGLTGLAPSPDETILYFTGLSGSNNAPIKRWDILGNTGLSDLAPGNGTNYVSADLLVLADASILALCFKTAGGHDLVVRRYDAAGALQNTYNFGAGSSGGTAPRICRGIDDPNSFWIWMHRSDGFSTFKNIKVSDGSILATLTALEFEDGTSQEAATATPTTRFGHSQSCPLLILRGAIVPPEPPPPPCIPPTDVSIGCPNDLPLAPSSGGLGCATDVPTSPLMEVAA